MIRLKPAAAGVIRWGIGLIWAFAGISKLVEIFVSTDESQLVTWASRFPVWVIVPLALAECAVAALLFSGGRRAIFGLVLGSLFLGAFTVTLQLWPPTLKQPCGCMGGIKLLDGIDPHAKIVFFAGCHCLAGMMTWPHKGSSRRSLQAA